MCFIKEDYRVNFSLEVDLVLQGIAFIRQYFGGKNLRGKTYPFEVTKSIGKLLSFLPQTLEDIESLKRRNEEVRQRKAEQKES